jgi:hypothetical protein
MDYEYTFAPTIKWGTIQSIIVLVAQWWWKIKHPDVKIMFLYEKLQDEIFMQQP